LIDIYTALSDIGHPVVKTSVPTQITCPFHKGGHEASPSARLYPSTDSFYCFACHQSYTPISVLATYYEMPYGEVFSYLKKQYGVDTVGSYRSVFSKGGLDYNISELIKCFFALSIKEQKSRFNDLDLILVRAARGEYTKSVIEDSDRMKVELWPRLR